MRFKIWRKQIMNKLIIILLFISSFFVYASPSDKPTAFDKDSFYKFAKKHLPKSQSDILKTSFSYIDVEVEEDAIGWFTVSYIKDMMKLYSKLNILTRMYLGDKKIGPYKLKKILREFEKVKINLVQDSVINFISDW